MKEQSIYEWACDKLGIPLQQIRLFLLSLANHILSKSDIMSQVRIHFIVLNVSMLTMSSLFGK